MNWKRGLFRAWVLITVLWLMLTAIVFRPDQGVPYFLDSSLGAEDASFVAFPGSETDKGMRTYLVTAPDGKSYRITAESADAALDAAKAARENPGAEVTVEELRPWEKHQLRQNATERARARKALSELRDFALMGTIPPALLFVLGVSFLWVFRGFRT